MTNDDLTQPADPDRPNWLVSRRSLLKGAAAGVAAGALSLRATSASASGTTIAEENARPGSSGWDIGEPDDSIEGFATQFSVNAGRRIYFKIRTDSTNYRVDIFRIGWYGGAGGRKVATIKPSVTLPQRQPSPLVDEYTGLVDCGNWGVSCNWSIPAAAVSGVYVANLIRLDGEKRGRANRILFVVRNDGRRSDLLVQTSDTTFQAYNEWGGASLYTGQGHFGRAVKVSYNRPLAIKELENSFWYAELPLVRWLERNGYDVIYIAGVDTDRRPSELLAHRVFVSSGHDEYWSGPQRANVEAARDAGVHLVFMTGNELFWKVRWERSVDRSHTSYRTLVCYKETLEGQKVDPSNEWTGTWRDPRFSPPSDGGRPENALTGTLFAAINPDEAADFAIEVPATYGRLRMWRHTAIAELAPGTIATLPTGTLGYEWNIEADDLPARPPGLVRFSKTTEIANQVLQDYGKTYVRGPATHHVTMYRHGSGALVWSTGTVQWAWGLDDYHLNHPAVPVPVDERMQQATVNVLADMGVQPRTLASRLVKASKSTDTTPPVTTISTPPANASLVIGNPVTITGTALDRDGTVGVVEVSIDGGGTWKPATGTSPWRYSFTPRRPGATTILVRATDDSLNTESPQSRTFNAIDRPPPWSLFTSSTPLPKQTYAEATPMELGVVFQTAVNGAATAIRFYKATENTGVHTGRLWTNRGSLLATVQFTGETSKGWQEARFNPPVALTAGVPYVVSYSCPTGRYSADAGFFDVDYSLPPLSAPASTPERGNGRFGDIGSFPTKTYGAANYWVDVVVTTR